MIIDTDITDPESIDRLLEQLDQHGWIISGDGGLKVDHQPDV